MGVLYSHSTFLCIFIIANTDPNKNLSGFGAEFGSLLAELQDLDPYQYHAILISTWFGYVFIQLASSGSKSQPNYQLLPNLFLGL